MSHPLLNNPVRSNEVSAEMPGLRKSGLRLKPSDQELIRLTLEDPRRQFHARVQGTFDPDFDAYGKI